MTPLTPYVIEFLLAVLAVLGSVLIVLELRRRHDWPLTIFFTTFSLAPFWFAMAHFRLIAIGEPDWVLNRWASLTVRIPLLLALYGAVWRLWRRRTNDG